MIAFLGLGAMGSRMAFNLIKAGHTLTVWNRDVEKARPLADAGATIGRSPKAAAEGAEIVMSMVTDDAAARSVWLEAEVGALHGLRAGTIALECSTVTPAWIRKLGRAVGAVRATLLDAPVAGSRPQAEAGELVFIIGGDTEAAERVLPVLASLAADSLHVGALGQGAVLKLAVNTPFAAQLESVAELLGFLVKNGFEANEAASLLANFPIVSPPIAGAAKMMAAKNTVPLFTIDLIEKDLNYILDTARDTGADLPGAASARSAFRRAQAKGLGQANISGLAAVFA
jgi:3-hydroxyisobutyrate dehydrogenase